MKESFPGTLFHIKIHTNLHKHISEKLSDMCINKGKTMDAPYLLGVCSIRTLDRDWDQWLASPSDENVIHPNILKTNILQHNNKKKQQEHVTK